MPVNGLWGLYCHFAVYLSIWNQHFETVKMPISNNKAGCCLQLNNSNFEVIPRSLSFQIMSFLNPEKLRFFSQALKTRVLRHAPLILNQNRSLVFLPQEQSDQSTGWATAKGGRYQRWLSRMARPRRGTASRLETGRCIEVGWWRCVDVIGLLPLRHCAHRRGVVAVGRERGAVTRARRAAVAFRAKPVQGLSEKEGLAEIGVQA